MEVPSSELEDAVSELQRNPFTRLLEIIATLGISNGKRNGAPKDLAGLDDDVRRAADRRVARAGRRQTRITERIVGNVVVLDLEGELRIRGAGLEDRLTRLLESGRKEIVLHLARLSDIDEYGIGDLKRAFEFTAREGGTLTLVNAPDFVKRSLAMPELRDPEDPGTGVRVPHQPPQPRLPPLSAAVDLPEFDA